MQTIFLLGAGPQQLPAFREAKALELMIVAADPNPDAVGFPLADASLVCDLRDFDACLAFAQRHAVDGVFTMAADYPVPLVAHLCHALGLCGVSPQAALSCTDKWAMQQAWSREALPTATSFLAVDEDECLDWCPKQRGTLLFKPRWSSGGRGVTSLPADADRLEIINAYRRAAGCTQLQGVLLQAYIDGPEISVESITCNGRTEVVAVTDKRTTGSPYHVEIRHTQPSRLTAREIADVSEMAKAAVAALGVDNAACHTEMKISAAGPVLIEVGARLAGGYIGSYLVPVSSGVNLVRAAMDMALGRAPSITPQHRRAAAVRFLTPQPGRVTSVRGVEQAARMPGIVCAHVDVTEGDRVPPLVDDGCRVGYVVATASDRQRAAQRAEQAAEGIAIETTAESDETGPQTDRGAVAG
jgi:biotin carboxylase